jgi:hypothetical protein
MRRGEIGDDGVRLPKQKVAVLEEWHPPVRVHREKRRRAGLAAEEVDAGVFECDPEFVCDGTKLAAVGETGKS